MIPAKVIHIGVDVSHRIPLLESRGCKVKECRSLSEALSTLESEDVDVIVLANTEQWDEQRLLRSVRRYTSAPFIVFENLPSGRGRSGFDLVIEPLTPPDSWLQKFVAFLDPRRAAHVPKLQSSRTNRRPMPGDVPEGLPQSQPR